MPQGHVAARVRAALLCSGLRVLTLGAVVPPLLQEASPHTERRGFLPRGSLLSFHGSAGSRAAARVPVETAAAGLAAASAIHKYISVCELDDFDVLVIAQDSALLPPTLL